MKLKHLLIEIISLYSLADIKKLGITYDIKSYSRHQLSMSFKYKEHVYGLFISPTKDPKINSIFYGVYINGKINTQIELKSPATSVVLSTIFGFIYRYLKSFGIKSFEYSCDPRRHGLYSHFLIKYFPEYKLVNKHNDSYTWSKVQS